MEVKKKTLAVDGPINTQPRAVTWDGTDGLGRRVPAGIYFIALETTGQRVVVKAVLIR